MRELLYLTYKSILNRKLTFLLSVFSIAISVVLLLGVDKAIKSSKSHFINTINETDIVVGSSNGSLDILLNLVFHLSDPLKEMSYKSFEDIKAFDEIEWAVPLSLGDKFHGFDVVSTNEEYFKYYRYSSSKSLEFERGKGFEEFYDVVLGSKIAKKLKMKVGDIVHISHGSHHHEHKNRDFKVVGILNQTLTPNDETLFMQLKADEAIHLEWQSGHFVDMGISSEKLSHMNIKPKHISGMFLGLKSRETILSVEEKIENYKDENLKAVIPAKALSKLYKLMKNMQDILMLISLAVFITAIFTMLSSMYSTLNERRREMAIFRSLGAGVNVIFWLFAMEALLIVISGVIFGLVTLEIVLYVISVNFPFEIMFILDTYELFMLLVIIGVALIASLFPAFSSYKSSLQDGLMVKM